MAATRFCSECGGRFHAKRNTLLPFRSSCLHCSPGFRRGRLISLAVAVMCLTIGFAIGRYTTRREPFHFIGTPIELSASRITVPANDNFVRSSRENETRPRAEQLLIPPSAAEGICGAPTKSGKLCRRKVRGGGYCWQHREKFAPKKSDRKNAN